MIRYPHTVTILHATATTNGYGDQVLDWATATRTPARAWMQPGVSSENLADRDTTKTAWRAFLPPGTDVAAADRVEWQGRTFEVDGDPAVWDGRLAHLEVALQQTN